MWKKLKNFLPRIILSLLLVFACCYSSVGYTMTQTATSQSITIPMEVWNGLKNDWMILDKELISCKSEMQKIKKPSSELLKQLSEAEKTLKQLQEELQKQNADLILLSKQAEESKTELKMLKEQINKERKTHKRQIWQNRFWCLLGGFVIGFAVGK